MMKILYTGAFRFPNKDAAAYRVQTIADIFKSLNHEVIFAGWEDTYLGDKIYTYRSYKCYSQNEFRAKPENILIRVWGFFWTGQNTLKWFLKNHNFDAVIIYNPPFIFTMLMFFLCKKFKIKLILDSTEWYDPSHLPGGKYGPAAFELFLRMRIAYRLIKNIICISTFLENYFQTKNKIRIPALINSDFDLSNNELCELDIRNEIRFIYAGIPGKKDKLIKFIEALPEVEKHINKKIIFYLIGVDSLEQVFIKDNVEKYDKIVNCIGFVDRNEVFKLYRCSHFSILFRENARYAHAGFPTKAMESWSNGCPIITNAMGDLSYIAKNMINSLVLDENNLVENMAFALKNIINNEDAYNLLRQESIITAEQNFVGSLYKEKVKSFIDKMH